MLILGPGPGPGAVAGGEARWVLKVYIFCLPAPLARWGVREQLSGLGPLPTFLSKHPQHFVFSPPYRTVGLTVKTLQQSVQQLRKRNGIMRALLGNEFQEAQEQVTARIPCNVFDLWVHWERAGWHVRVRPAPAAAFGNMGSWKFRRVGIWSSGNVNPQVPQITISQHQHPC